MSSAASVADILKDLVALESVNPAHPGGGRGEAAVAGYIADFCSRLGMEHLDAGGYPGRPNEVWRLPVLGAAATLMFEAHMDTMTLAGMDGGDRPRLANGRIYGRGACDTKGSLAAMLCAVAELARRPAGLAANILLAGIVDEEVACGGAKLFVESGLRPDSIIVGEPTGLMPCIVHTGFARFFIRTRGRAAHSSQPRHGDNAILQMLKVIRHLSEEVEPRVASLVHPVTGPALQNLTMIYGGHTINFIPDECRLGVDRRTTPAEDPWAVLEDYRAVLARFGSAYPDVAADLQVYAVLSGLDCPPDAAIAQAALDAVRVLVDPQATYASGGSGAGCTDASYYWGLARIPCVVLGPGDVAQAHTSDEWIDVDQLEAAVPLYAEVARRFSPHGAVAR